MVNYPRRIAVTLFVFALIGGMAWWLQNGDVAGRRDTKPINSSVAETTPIPPPVTPVVPPPSTSPYLNTASAATYISASACVACHPDAASSYQQTAHGLALAEIDPSKLPPAGKFFHAAQGILVDVSHQGNAARHRDWAIVDDHEPVANSEKVALSEYPMAYAIGSGHNALSFLAEVDGFLIESPATWYTDKQKWDLSPGYELGDYNGFKRGVDLLCVRCHSGRFELIDNSPQRIKFHELSIGCESCHGPGSLHAAAHESGSAEASDVDYSIVNPAQLPRELNEAICAQCHLATGADAYVRGRDESDYRPGLPLADYRISYRVDEADTSMTVAGHFEQMRKSKCYSETETLTCTTCHNPHDVPDKESSVAYYREKCMQCHAATGGCDLAESERLLKSPDNDCAACHMKSTAVRIPHVTFTHHRIGLQQATEYEKPTPSAGLVPVTLPGGLSQADQDRCLGLATFDFSDDDIYRQRAFSLLQDAYSHGLRDSAVTSALAWMLFEMDSDDCITLAVEALKSPDIRPHERVNCLEVIGRMHFRRNQFRESEAAFQQLVTLYRRSRYWVTLGVCRARLNNMEGATLAFEKAAEISPDDFTIRTLLADHYSAVGQTSASDTQREIAAQTKEAPRSISTAAAKTITSLGDLRRKCLYGGLIGRKGGACRKPVHLSQQKKASVDDTQAFDVWTVSTACLDPWSC